MIARPVHASLGAANIETTLLSKKFHPAQPSGISYSARSAGNKGERSAAHVATTEAVNPDINTASSNKPSETLGS